MNEEDFAVHEDRLSDVDGYTLVVHDDTSVTVHLLRAYEECNLDDAHKKIKIEGGREAVITALGELGATQVASCKHCFPEPTP